MIVIAVELIVDPEHAGAFRERVLKHSSNSLGEPGCVAFDVAEDREQRGRFLIWESYVDMDAVEHHRGQGYLAEFRDATASTVKHRVLTLCDMITPARA